MVIQKIENKDIDCVAPLVAKFRDTLRGLKGYLPRDDLSAAGKKWMDYCQPGFSTYIAYEGSQCVGYLVCRIDTPTVWVESVYVLPEFRKKGIASALYEQAERLAQSFGEDTVYNYVHPNNDAMIGFLRKRGYDVLNMIEIRKKYEGEVIRMKVQVGEHQFDY